jgi:hypothetical protein
MRAALHALLLSVSLVLVTAGTSPAAAADDEYIGLLLESRRLVAEGIAETRAELEALETKANDDDLLVFPTASGVIEVDLRRAHEVVPLVQVALSDPEIKAMVLRGLQQADPDLWAWAKLFDEGRGFIPGFGLENVPPSLVVEAIRSNYGQTKAYRTEVYREYALALRAELRTLEAIARVVEDQLAELTDLDDDVCEADGENAIETLCAPDEAEPTLEPEPTPEPSSEQCGQSDMWCQDPVQPVEDTFSGCWQSPFGHGIVWAEIDQVGEDFTGRTVARWQWGQDAVPQMALGSVSGDIRSGRPAGILYGTGPFDEMYTCAAASGGTNQWGAFSYWEYDDGPSWLPCNRRDIELLDPAGNDYSWALSTFGFERVSLDVCDAAFAEAGERG